MSIAKWLAKFLISTIIIVVTPYFVISLFVAFYKLNGVLVEGQRMYFDFYTPTWGGLLMFQTACIALITFGFYLRRKLTRQGKQSKEECHVPIS